MTTRIRGILRMTSPLLLNQEQPERPGTCTRISKRKISTSKTTGGPAAETCLPILSRYTIWSALRHCAADLIFDALVLRHQKLSTKAFHLVSCGASADADTEAATESERRQATADPFIGLFGGVTKTGEANTLIKSSLVVTNGIPICPETIEAGLADERFSSYETGSALLTQVEVYPEGEEDVVVPSSVVELVGDPDQVIAKWKQYLSERLKRCGEVEESVLCTWSCREVVAPGVAFETDIEVTAQDYVKIGLTLLALEKMVERNALGGRTTIGYGHFKALEFSLETGGISAAVFTKDGKLNVENAMIRRYVRAAKEFLAQIDSAKIEELCRG